MTEARIAVLGAGMVGVCCALELQSRGHAVTLIEREHPAAQTSGGNAGVVARSSLVPINNPGLWLTLPQLISSAGGNGSSALRYDLGYLLHQPAWVLGFLASTRQSVFEVTAQALDALIRLSSERHRHWSAAARVAHLWRHDGWLYAYRDAVACKRAAGARAVWSRFGVAHQVLQAPELTALEPALGSAYAVAVWVRDAAAAASPQQVVQAYADCFVRQGGTLLRDEIRTLAPVDAGRWRLQMVRAGESQFARVVVCLGPWSPELLAPLGLRVPMAFERGYHMHYGWAGDTPLTRPVYDTAAACVLSPMRQGLRLTTGVELTHRDAASDFGQLDAAEAAVRAVLPLGQRLDAAPWRGARPTLPDSRPVIGQASRHPGLWLAFGHQHIGFSTGPGTAAMLGAMLDGQAPAVDALPFSPARLGL